MEIHLMGKYYYYAIMNPEYSFNGLRISIIPCMCGYLAMSSKPHHGVVLVVFKISVQIQIDLNKYLCILHADEERIHKASEILRVQRLM